MLGAGPTPWVSPCPRELQPRKRMSKIASLTSLSLSDHA